MLGGLRKSLSRQCCQRFAKVAASAKRAPGLLLGHACELDRTPFRRGDGPTTRQIEAAAGGALPPEDLPATALPAGPDGLLFVGFVDRPRLFAFLPHRTRARRRGVRYSAIRTHGKRMLMRLGLHDRVQIVIFA